ncbi:ABC transporter ATP-binding protein [Desulfovibrio inopinatus]|uniref:ABC transporter ATP-binding protein n=1 Tax=Desulfovibrio inopinatus TaxID=102109 RepID=UPI00042510B7
MSVDRGTNLLTMRDIGVRFGGIQALSGADIQVDEGDIAAIIGPNGAGKTTLLNVISGMVLPNDGTVLFDGQDISTQPPHKRARLGVVRTFQNLEVFSNMTVLENVMTGAHRLVEYGVLASIFKSPGYHAGERRLRELAIDRLEFVGLADKAHHPAGDLPYGSQRLLEMARAMAAKPKLLLLDEPAAGLNTKETGRLAEIILAMRDDYGISIVLVEHDMDLIMEISNPITVLNFGSVITTGTPREVQTHPEVIAAYLGEDD